MGARLRIAQLLVAFIVLLTAACYLPEDPAPFNGNGLTVSGVRFWKRTDGTV